MTNTIGAFANGSMTKCSIFSTHSVSTTNSWANPSLESKSRLGCHTPSASEIAGITSLGSNLNALVAEAAKDLADYQRLTAEGKLGEAGQKLEHLKRTLDKLNTGQR